MLRLRGTNVNRWRRDRAAAHRGGAPSSWRWSGSGRSGRKARNLTVQPGRVAEDRAQRSPKVLDGRGSFNYKEQVSPTLSGPERKPKISRLTAYLWLGAFFAFVALIAISVMKQV